MYSVIYFTSRAENTDECRPPSTTVKVSRESSVKRPVCVATDDLHFPIMIIDAHRQFCLDIFRTMHTFAVSSTCSKISIQLQKQMQIDTFANVHTDYTFAD